MNNCWFNKPRIELEVIKIIPLLHLQAFLSEWRTNKIKKQAIISLKNLKIEVGFDSAWSSNSNYLSNTPLFRKRRNNKRQKIQGNENSVIHEGKTPFPVPLESLTGSHSSCTGSNDFPDRYPW